MMNRSIQFIVCVLAILCQNINSAVAQTRSYDGVISVVPVQLEQRGKSVYINIDFVLEDVKVKSAHGVDFIPQLVAPAHTYNLPKVSIKGHNEYLAYERWLSLMSAKEKDSYEKPYVVEKGSKKRNDTIRYRYILPYESWMDDARVDVQRDECGCGEIQLMDVEPLGDIELERILVPYVVTPFFAYLQPKAEEVKSRDIQAECFLDFEVNKINIRPEYMNNPKELAKIRAMIDELKSDPSIKVNKLDIVGYASPEGSLANNKRLSEGRAMALRDYLASRYDFSRNQYFIIFGGENWDGLVKALDTIDFEYKDEALNIINDIPVEKGREAKLMQLRGGVPYRYMLKYIFPSLRVAICKVNYEIKNFNLDEAKEIIKTRPQNLSLNEMFMVANSYPKGSQEFIDVFETAVRMYPKDEIASINAAAAALGTYIFWIDADDYADEKLLEKALPPLEAGNDVVVYGVNLFRPDGSIEEKRIRALNRTTADWKKDTLNALISTLWTYGTKRSFWDGEVAPFQVARSAADGYMTIRIFDKAKTITAIPDILYSYRDDSPSSIRHTFTAIRYLGNSFLWYYRLKLSEKYYKENVNICSARAMSGFVKSFALDTVTHNLTDEGRIYIRNALANLSSYPIHGRYRDKLLAWAIKNNHLSLCRLYARRKLKKWKASQK